MNLLQQGFVKAFRDSYKKGVNPFTGQQKITDGASTNFVRHHNSANRNDVLGLSDDKILDNTREVIMQNRNSLVVGDNVFSTKINGVDYMIKSHMQPNGTITSMNLHPETGTSPFRRGTNIIKINNMIWK